MILTQLLSLIEQETRLKSEWDDPNYLADLLPRLASYYATLGPFVADAELEADDAEITYKVNLATEAANQIEERGLSVAAAEKNAISETEDTRRLHAKLHHKARLLFLARQSLSVTIDAVRSKLSFIKIDMETK